MMAKVRIGLALAISAYGVLGLLFHITVLLAWPLIAANRLTEPDWIYYPLFVHLLAAGIVYFDLLWVGQEWQGLLSLSESLKRTLRTCWLVALIAFFALASLCYIPREYTSHIPLGKMAYHGAMIVSSAVFFVWGLFGFESVCTRAFFAFVRCPLEGPCRLALKLVRRIRGKKGRRL